VVVQSLRVLSSLKKFGSIFSRFCCFPSWCSRYDARFVPCFFESLPSHYNPFHLHHVLLVFDSIIQPVLIVVFYHIGCQVELVVLFVGIETVFGIEMMMNFHHRLLWRKSWWKLRRIDVIKHGFWSSLKRIPLVSAMWL